MKIIERRGILRGLAATALAAPLTQLLQLRSARTAPNAPVPKVVFFYTPCGVVPDVWHPKETGTVFTLPKLSAPLAPHQADCIFLDGVSMYPLNDHQGGSQQLLAGWEKDVKTLDLQLGDFLKASAPFSSIQLGIQSRISKGGSVAAPHPHFTRISLAQEVFAEDNPLAAFASIFGDASSSGGMMNDAALMLLAARKKSILDTSTADLVSLSSRLPGSEKQKVETFTESIRALERRLTDPSTMAASCNDLSKFNPTKFTVPQVTNANQASYNQTANRAVVSDLQLETARLALACGRTRVVSIVYEHTNAHNPIQGVGTFGVHDSSHFNAPPGQLIGDATQEQKDAKMAAWQAYRVWYAERLAQFIQMLKDTPDTTGTLFDNTIILHASELGDSGPHKTDRIPYVFAGGRALGFKLGQALNFSGMLPAAGGQHSGIKNLAHSTLLTIVAKVMGLPLDTPLFGYSGAQALAPEAIGVI
jgi:hypothetical protein